MAKKVNPKLDKAIILLRQGNNCKTVAAMVGYTPPAFNVAFKKYYGKTPAQFVPNEPVIKTLDLGRIDLYIHANVHATVDEEALAKFLNMRRQDLIANFLDQEGVRLDKYWEDKRMAVIIKYIEDGYEIELISKLMNFVSVGAFEHFFRANAGYSISVYRKRLLNEGPGSIRSKELMSDMTLIEAYIKENLSDENLSISIKKKFRMSVWLLNKRFYELKGLSLNENILKERMNLVKSLVARQVSLEEMARQTGYLSIEQLSIDYRHFFKEESNDLFEQTDFRSSKDIFELLRHYVNDHLANQITIEGIASFFQLNKEKVIAVIRQNTPLNFNTYIRQLRIEKVKEYLQAGDEVSEIAPKVGYASELSLEQAFRQVNKITIRQYLSKSSTGDLARTVQNRKNHS